MAKGNTIMDAWICNSPWISNKWVGVGGTAIDAWRSNPGRLSRRYKYASHRLMNDTWYDIWQMLYMMSEVYMDVVRLKSSNPWPWPWPWPWGVVNDDGDDAWWGLFNDANAPPTPSLIVLADLVRNLRNAPYTYIQHMSDDQIPSRMGMTWHYGAIIYLFDLNLEFNLIFFFHDLRVTNAYEWLVR